MERAKHLKENEIKFEKINREYFSKCFVFLSGKKLILENLNF